MKKFLTVLLVIAVMFTLSFGTAFAFEAGTAPDTISDGYFETLWANYVKDAGGETISIESFDVEKAIIAGFKAEAKAAYDEYMATQEAYVTGDSAFAGILAGATKKASAFRLAVAKAQFDADKADALKKLGTVPTFNYSTKVMSTAAATDAEGVSTVKFVGKDYTYQKAAEKLVEYFKGLVEDEDSFDADVNVAAYKTASGNVKGIVGGALYPICFTDDAATIIEKTGAYDLQIAYAAGDVKTGTVAGVASTEYIKSGTNNEWSTQKVDATEKIEDANVAAAKATNSAKYAAYLVANPTKTEYADKWLKVADILVEDNPSAAITAPNGTVYADNADAIAELEAYAAKWGAEKDANGQLVRDAAKVKKAVEDGTVAIAKASGAGIATALTDAKTAVDNAKTKAAADELAFVKESAKKGIELTVADAVADEVYYEVELNKVKSYAEEYTAKVEAAESKADVKEVYEAFLAKVAAVNTADALDTSWTTAMTTVGRSEKVLYDAAEGYADYYISGLENTTTDGAAYDKTTLKARVAAMIGKSGLRTQTEIKTLKEEAIKVAQALPTNDDVKAAKKAIKTANDALPTKATVADLAAVQAVSDAIAAYNDLTTVAHGLTLTAYTKAVDAIVDGYNLQFAQQFAKVSDTDEVAIKALIADIDTAVDALGALKTPASPSTTYMTTMKGTLNGYLANIKTAEADAVRAAINAIPVNVTDADKTTVEKARKLYDEYVAKYNNYKALYNTTTSPLTMTDYTKGYAGDDIVITALETAETVIGLNQPSEEENVKALLADVTAKASSAKVSKGIKVTVKADVSALEEAGYTVEYKFYRSTKKASGYTYKKTSKTGSYTNTSGKKGVKYYYKAKLVVKNAVGEVVAEAPLKQCTYACRTWK